MLRVWGMFGICVRLPAISNYFFHFWVFLYNNFVLEPDPAAVSLTLVMKSNFNLKRWCECSQSTFPVSWLEPHSLFMQSVQSSLLLLSCKCWGQLWPLLILCKGEAAFTSPPPPPHLPLPTPGQMNDHSWMSHVLGPALWQKTVCACLCVCEIELSVERLSNHFFLSPCNQDVYVWDFTSCSSSQCDWLTICSVSSVSLVSSPDQKTSCQKF